MRYAIALDVGGTTIKAGVVGTDGAVWQPGQYPTPASPDALITRSARIISDYGRMILEGEVAGADGPIQPSQVIDTVGFDVPGIVDESLGMAVFSANLGWRDFPAREALSDASGRPVAFGHDVRTGALAEAHWGVGLENFFYVAIGTGIASVLILNGMPVAVSGWAGELGQITVPDWDGNPVSLERVASASAICRRGASLGLIEECDGAAGLYQLVDSGSPEATQIVDYSMKQLAEALAPIVSAVGKVPIVIGGGLANRGQKLFDELSTKLDEALGIVPTPEVIGAKLGSQSQLKGAGLRAFRAER
ncbi:MAG: ROK family protein [Actinomycetaceae bacterium]|nr:ROK family protein [Actinomycetaceae bacterium]